jgi:hypothetical protein
MHILKTAFFWCILISGLAASVARSDSPDHTAAAKLTKEAIIGAWRLVGIDFSGPNGSLTDPVFGPNPQGIIIYDSSGWMSVQIVTANRPTIPKPASRTSSVLSTDEAMLAAQAFNTYYAYFGSWEFDAVESAITHHLRASLLPYETGVEYRPEVTFDGIHLKLIVRSQQNGETRQRTLVWARVSDSGLVAAPSGSPLAGAQGSSRTGGSAAPVTQTESLPPTRVAGTKYGDMPTDYEEAVRKYLQEHLKYPDSVQYQSITMPEQGYTTAVTGTILMREKREYGWTVKATINAKNSHALYVGLKTYTFLFRGAKIVDVRLPLPGDEMN